MILLATGILAILLYGAASLWPARARALAVAAVLLHTVELFVDVLGGGTPGFAESLSVSGLAIGVAGTVMARGRNFAVARGLLPLAAILLGASLVLPSPQVSALQGSPNSLWLPAHLLFMFTAIGAFVLDFVVGILQLAVRRRLKARDFDGIQQMPALGALSALQTRALGVGLLALTLGLGTGGMWAASLLSHHAWLSDPKVVFTLFVWLWYAMLLGLRLNAGWRGRSAVALSAVGIAGIVFSLVGLDFLSEGFHAYGG